MDWSITLINGLAFGIAHTDSIFIEDIETGEVEVGHGIIIFLGFIQIALYW